MLLIIGFWYKLMVLSGLLLFLDKEIFGT
jgi:hypothetical protein